MLDNDFSRLSQSQIWKFMNRYFTEAGVDIWKSNDIPNYATSNSFIAHSYARVVENYFRDCRDAERADKQYIFELGAGAGRFSYHFLQHFFSDDPHARGLENVVYVMTDIAPATIKHWKQHPQFQPFIAAGQLDFAKLDITNFNNIHLEIADISLTAGQVQQPAVMIANYVFDSIPADLFSFSNGRLSERLCSVKFDETIKDFPAAIKQTIPKYQHRRCGSNYYKDPKWNQILSEHCDFGGEFQFTLPIGAFLGIENMQKIATGDLLVLTSDYGEMDIQAVSERQSATVHHNGNLTTSVNFYALERYTTLSGGIVLPATGSGDPITTVGYLFSREKYAVPLTKQAFRERIQNFGPEDFSVLRKQAASMRDQLSFEQAVAMIRLSHYDSGIFSIVWKTLDKASLSNKKAVRKTLISLLSKVQQFLFHFDLEAEQGLRVAKILANVGKLEDAINLVIRLKDYHEPKAHIETVLGTLYQQGGQWEIALAQAKAALVLDPNLERAHKLMRECKSELSES